MMRAMQRSQAAKSAVAPLNQTEVSSFFDVAQDTGHTDS